LPINAKHFGASGAATAELTADRAESAKLQAPAASRTDTDRGELERREGEDMISNPADRPGSLRPW
jgi:hypothetical protein